MEKESQDDLAKRFDEILNEDKEVQRIDKTTEAKLNNLGITNAKQQEVIRQGKPMPVLKPNGVKYIQNTSKEQQRQDERMQRQVKEIDERAKLAKAKRREEIGKMHPKEYQAYKNRERLKEAKENIKSIDKERER